MMTDDLTAEDEVLAEDSQSESAPAPAEAPAAAAPSPAAPPADAPQLSLPAEPEAGELAALPPAPEPEASSEPADLPAEPATPAVPELPAAAQPDVPAAPAEEDHAEEGAEVQAPREQPHTSIRKKRYWRTVLTGDPETIPLEVRRKVGVDDWDLSREHREYRLMQAVNKSWAADHLPRTREQINVNWPRERYELAKRFGVRNNEREVFMALSQHTADEKRRQAARRICETSYMAGLDGEIAPDIIDLTDGLNESDAEHAGSLADAAFQRGQATRNRLMETAKFIANGVEFFAAAEEDAMSLPRMLTNFPDFIYAALDLHQMGETDRNTALYLASKMIPEEERPGVLSRGIRAVRRSAMRMGLNVIQTFGHLNATLLKNVGEAIKDPKMQIQAADVDDLMQVLDRLRRFSQEEMRPLVLPEEMQNASSYFINVAEAIPSALLALCGGAGISALTISSVGESVSEARMRSPETAQDKQFLASSLAGALQAGLYLNLNRIGGNLLAQSVARVGQGTRQGVSGALVNGLDLMGGSLGEGAKLLAAGKIAHGMDLGLQQIASDADHQLSNIDWQAFGSNLTDIEANMHEAASLLPVLLLSSGHVRLEHFRSPRAILGDGKLLLDCGISPEQLELIKAEPDRGKQSDLLQKALQSSEIWSSQDFMDDIMRAMQLLNGPEAKPFEDKDVVADFLKLPPEKREMLRETRLINNLISDQGTPRRTEALHLWGKWLNAARMNLTKKGIASLPEVVEEDGQLMLPSSRRQDPGTDMFGDLHAFSYKVLLNHFTVDTLMDSAHSLAEMEAKCEKYRQNFLMQTAVNVIARGPGAGRWGREGRRPQLPAPGEYGREPGMSKIIKDIGASYLLKDVVKKTHSHLPNYVILNKQAMGEEFRNYVDAVASSIPDMEDFQTALSRGLAPDEAYAHILARELNLPADDLLKLCRKKGVQESRPMKRATFIRESLRRFNMLSDMTGWKVESTVNEEGMTFYRARRPDGSYTRWHEKEEYAKQDVAGHAFMSFMKRGEWVSLKDRVSTEEQSQSEDYTRLEDKNSLTDFDRLCEAAVGDFTKLWNGVATNCQPGHKSGYYRQFLRGFRDQSRDDGVSPRLREEDSLTGEYSMDDMSVVTPMAMLQARFYVYWRRLVDSDYISTNMLADFLADQGYLTWKSIKNPFDPKPPRGKRVVDKTIMGKTFRADDPEQVFKYNHSDRRYDDLCSMMAEYNTQYFLSTIQERDVPDSVKRWVATLPFMVVRRPSGRGEGNGTRIVRRDGIMPEERELTIWANHKVALKLQGMSSTLRKIREHKKKKTQAFMDELVRDAFSENNELKAERAWLHSLGGEDVLQTLSPHYWNMLHRPYRTWRRLEGEDRRMINGKLWAAFEKIPYISEGAEREDRFIVDYGLAMLEDFMLQHPDVHHLSRFNASAGEVSRVILAQKASNQVPTNGDDAMKSGAEIVTIPATGMPDSGIRMNARTRACMDMLDCLREMTVTMPRAVKTGVMWDGRLYGYYGRPPRGLERNFEANVPLQPLYDVMRRLDPGEHIVSGPVKVCGETLSYLRADEDITSIVQGNTVYRHSDDHSHRYRLMQGDASAEQDYLRTPYIVHNRHGVYIDNTQAVQSFKDYDRSIAVSLDVFNRQLERDYPINGPAWASAALTRNFAGALKLCSEAYEEGGLNPRNAARMVEYIMRLGEDSGFSDKMRTTDLSKMTLGEVRLFNMLADMMKAVCSPRSMGALKRLNDLAIKSRENEESVRPILSALMSANGELPEGWYFSPDHFTLPKEKKPRKKPKKKEGLTVLRDIESEKMPVRSGRKKRLLAEQAAREAAQAAEAAAAAAEQAAAAEEQKPQTPAKSLESIIAENLEWTDAESTDTPGTEEPTE